MTVAFNDDKTRVAITYDLSGRYVIVEIREGWIVPIPLPETGGGLIDADGS